MNNWYNDDRGCNDMYKMEEKKMICHCKVEEKKPCYEYKDNKCNYKYEDKCCKPFMKY